MIGWVFFRADNFAYSFQYLKAMFGISGQSFIDDNTMLYVHEYIIVFLIAFIAATPILKKNEKHTRTCAKNVYVHNAIFTSYIITNIIYDFGYVLD